MPEHQAESATPAPTVMPAAVRELDHYARPAGDLLPAMRVTGGLPVQRKLEVGASDDPLEHEADRVAEHVMRMPVAPIVQRECEECEEERETVSRKPSFAIPFIQRRSIGDGGTLSDEANAHISGTRGSGASLPSETRTFMEPAPVFRGATGVQMRPASTNRADAVEAPASVHEVLRSPGQPLDAATRTFMEPRFGQDFGTVRVHADTQAATSARDVNAQAYTVGRDIVFGSGRLSPSTPAGLRLIAHELTHVLQQTGALSGRGMPVEPNPNGLLARQPAEAAPEEEVVETETARETAEEEQAREAMGNIRYDKPPVNQNAPPRETVPSRDWRPDPNVAPPPSPYHDQGARTNWEAASRYRGAQKEAASLRYRLESTPRAVLERGGAPPDFVTLGKSEYHHVTRDEAFVWETLKGGNVEFTPRNFHILDAMEHDMRAVSTDDEAVGLYLAYFRPSAPALRPGISGAVKIGDRYYHPKLPPGAVIGRFFFDDLEKADQETLDKAFWDALNKRAAQLRVEQARAEKRRREAATIAEAEAVALKDVKDKRREGPCDLKIVAHTPSGKNNPQARRHHQYADHVAKEKGYGAVTTELKVTTPERVSYAFDTYNPKTQREVWEVKTQHEWTSPLGMATAPYKKKPDFETKIEDLDVQRLIGLYVATRCGLEFRYAVDNCDAFTGLRQQWALPPVEYIPFPGEKRLPCPQ